METQKEVREISLLTTAISARGRKNENPEGKWKGDEGRGKKKKQVVFAERGQKSGN